MPNSIIELNRNEVKLISGGDATTPVRNTADTKAYNFIIPPDNIDITSNVQPPEPQKKSWGTLMFQTLEVIGTVFLVGVVVYEIRKCVRGRVHPHSS
jgi:hypothetical protein